MFTTSFWTPLASHPAFDRRAAHMRRVGRLFDELTELESQRTRRTTPAAELSETPTEYTLTLQVPGLGPESLQLEWHGQQLSVRASRRTDVPDGYSAHRLERVAFDIAQRFTFPERVEPEQVQAKLQDGVLRITLGKAKEAQPRPIQVHVA